MNNNDNTENSQSQSDDPQAYNQSISASNFVLNNRTKKGIMLASLVIFGMLFPTASIFLLIVATFLVVSGQAPKQVDEFLKTVPFGDHVAHAISQIEKVLS
jgi:hypothetical protein